MLVENVRKVVTSPVGVGLLSSLIAVVGIAVAVPEAAPAPVAAPCVTQDAGAQDQEMQLPKPGAEHAWLAKRAGKWNTTTKYRDGADQPWMTSTGVEVTEVCCGGFFVSSVFKGSFMGMPFEGRQLMGYDQLKKKFVATWIDSFGSFMLHMDGTLSDDKKTLTLNCKMPDPGSGKEFDTRMTSVIDGDDQVTFSMYMPGPDGKEFKGMEIAYTRAK